MAGTPVSAIGPDVTYGLDDPENLQWNDAEKMYEVVDTTLFSNITVNVTVPDGYNISAYGVHPWTAEQGVGKVTDYENRVIGWDGVKNMASMTGITMVYAASSSSSLLTDTETDLMCVTIDTRAIQENQIENITIPIEFHSYNDTTPYPETWGGFIENEDEPVNISVVIKIHGKVTPPVSNLTFDPGDKGTCSVKYGKITRGECNVYDNKTGILIPSSSLIPTSHGYTFVGWNVSGENITVFNATGQLVPGTAGIYVKDGVWNASVQEILLSAYWKPNQTVVTLENETGKTFDIINLIYGEYPQPLSLFPEKCGYMFGGWYTGMSGTGSMVINATGSYQNVSGYVSSGKWVNESSAVTFSANWTANTYYVRFDGNGNTGGSMENQTFTYDAPAANLMKNTYVKTGYRFTGWEHPLGTRLYDDEAPVRNLTSDPYDTFVLYANWTANTTTVNFHNQSSTVSKINTVGKPYNATADPIQPGYTFTGWNVTFDGGTTWYPFNGNTTFVNATGIWVYAGADGGNLEVYANWTCNVTHAKFYLDDSCVTPIQTADFTYNQDIPSISVPVKSGYTFNGWNASSSIGPGVLNAFGQFINPAYGIGSRWTNTSANDTVLTLIANWSSNKTTVTFTDISESKTYVYDDSVVLPSTQPEKTGYHVKQWNVTEDAGATWHPFNSTGYNESGIWKYAGADGGKLNASAEWENNTYWVRFNGGGATSGTMADQLFTYDADAAPLRENTFKKDAYVFTGWDNSPVAATVNYTDKQAVRNLNATQGGITDLYAVWTAATPDDLEIIVSPASVTVGSAVQITVYYQNKTTGYRFSDKLEPVTVNITCPDGTFMEISGNTTVAESCTGTQVGTYTIYVNTSTVTGTHPSTFKVNAQPAPSSGKTHTSGQTVIIQSQPQKIDSGTQTITDVSSYYYGVEINTASAADVSVIQSVDAVYAADVQARFDAASMAGISIVNSKGAPALINSKEDIQDIDRVSFARVYDVSPAVSGEKLTKVTVPVLRSDIIASGLTTDDVNIYHYMQEYDLWIPLEILSIADEGEYLYYTAATDGASPFGVLIKRFDTSDVPDTPSTTTKSPVPFFGILAGLGVAVVLLRMRK